MLCFSPHRSSSHFHGGLRPNPNPNCSLFTLHLLKPPFINQSPSIIKATSSSSSSDETTLNLTPSQLSRRQNSKSTALFLLHSQPSSPIDTINKEEDKLDESEIARKKIIEEASLATRRIARFPGSIDFPKPEQSNYRIDLNRVALECDEEDIKKAIQIRRGVAAEILKEALRAGRLSVNYSDNLVLKLGGFVDRVVIEAAALKGVSEFRHVSFNARTKSYIQSSGVVALVK